MASVGIVNLQEAVFSEFGPIVAPTILDRVSMVVVVAAPVRYTVLCSKLNFGQIVLEEELQIWAKMDNVSPIQNK